MPSLTLGGVLKSAREQLNLSKRQLSLAAGLSESYVGKVESGEIDPSFRCFAKLACQLNLNAREVHLLVLQEASRD